MKFRISKLSTKELATFAQRVIFASKEGTYKLSETHPLLEKLEQEYAVYEKVYTKQTHSGKGAQVAELDAQRDKTFSDLKAFLKGYVRIETLPHAADAQALYELFERYGQRVEDLSYAEETAQLQKLIEELGQSENQTRLEALQLKPSFEALKSQQQAFEALYAEQAEANAQLRSQSSATALRKGLQSALRDYLSFVTAMKTLPEWKLLYAELNQLAQAMK